ncbi:MAG: hypothetical protein ACLU9S_19610 [Oscillospiraceae bacterium]
MQVRRWRPPGEGESIWTGDVIDVGVITGIDSDSAQGVTLACDNEGVLYTIDYGTGALYTVNKTTAKAAYVGETGYQSCSHNQ